MARLSWNAGVKANRTITKDEKLYLLPKQRNAFVEATDRGSLLQFNSTYSEYKDPIFFLRGSSYSLAVIFGSLVGLAMFLFFLMEFMFDNDLAVKAVGLLGIIFGLASFFVFFWLGVRHDFFTYTAYPVRFNRKNRKIYVFRPPKEGGVQAFFWDEVDFFINKPKYNSNNYLIGHVMDGDFIKFSFVVGDVYMKIEVIEELWQFIYRYMEEGPKSVKPPFISMTINNSIINNFIVSYTRVGVVRYISVILCFPFIGPLIALRWLILKTCKTPIWPDWVEAECAVVPNDPNYIPEPKYIGDGFEKNPDFLQKVLDERRKRDNRQKR